MAAQRTEGAARPLTRSGTRARAARDPKGLRVPRQGGALRRITVPRRTPLTLMRHHPTARCVLTVCGTKFGTRRGTPFPGPMGPVGGPQPRSTLT